MKRARSTRRGGESCRRLRVRPDTESRNLTGAMPRPALAGKAADADDDDDGGVIYGHNRGSGEKEKEGAEYGGRILVRLGTHARRRCCRTMNEQELDRIAGIQMIECVGSGFVSRIPSGRVGRGFGTERRRHRDRNPQLSQIIVEPGRGAPIAMRE